MSEYIVNVPDDKANEFISRFGIDDVRLLGFKLSEELIRCRDCKHVSRDEGKTWRECYRLGAYREFYVEPDGFCAWGERRINA